jgi:SAM-dependent methyltransferase
MRKLALDGAPTGTVYGADVSQDLITCGYEYFRDGGGEPKFMFFTGDILNLDDPVFATIEGQFDIIWTAMVYHLWDYKTQLTASIATVKLLKPVPGSVLVGWQLGATPAVEVARNLTDDRKDHRTMYRHDEKSFERLWGEVGEATGTRWNVVAKNWVWPSGKPKWGDGVAVNGSRGDIISFTVTRI